MEIQKVSLDASNTDNPPPNRIFWDNRKNALKPYIAEHYNISGMSTGAI
jgi:hypothetical protein